MKLNIYLLSTILFSSAYYSTKIERVIIIGLDGAGSFHKKIDTPNVNNLLKSGTYCDYGKAQLPTWSGQNWGSILTGVLPNKHGVTNGNIGNGYYNNTKYPSLFKTINNNFPNSKMASFCSWTPLNTGLIEKDVTVHRISDHDGNNVVEAVEYIKTQGKESKFIFFYLGEIDETGHSKKWMSTAYQNQYKKSDGFVGQVLNTIKQVGLDDSTLVLITADHGGINNSHGGITKSETEVLFGIRSPNVKVKALPYGAIHNMDAFALTLNALNITLPTYLDAKIPNGIYN